MSLGLPTLWLRVDLICQGWLRSVYSTLSHSLRFLEYSLHAQVRILFFTMG